MDVGGGGGRAREMLALFCTCGFPCISVSSFLITKQNQLQQYLKCRDFVFVIHWFFVVVVDR